MAVGGALRAAIKAGNFVKAASESRRRARALADMNARGGIRGSSQMDSLWNRGFEQPFAPGGAMSGYTPRGHHVIGNEATGARSVRDFQHSPIQAPYEGMRVMPGATFRDSFSTTSSLPPGPWQGRGRGPMWGRGGFSNEDGALDLVDAGRFNPEIFNNFTTPLGRPRSEINQVFQNDRWYYPQFRLPDRSLPAMFQQTYSPF